MSNPQNSILEIKNFFNRHGGLQRDNRYSVSFFGLPARIPQIPETELISLGINAGARSIDGLADNLMGYGPGRIVPRSQKYVGGILLTFPVTHDNFIINFFDAWFNEIYSGTRFGGGGGGSSQRPRGAYQLEFYDTIVKNCGLKLKLLDLNGNINRVLTFYEVYPLEALPLELNMMQQNEYLKYQVLMNYREYKIGDR